MKIDAFHYIQLGTVYRYVCTLLIPCLSSDHLYDDTNDMLFRNLHCLMFLIQRSSSSSWRRSNCHVWRLPCSSGDHEWLLWQGDQHLHTVMCPHRYCNKHNNYDNDFPAEFTWPYDETVHGHILPAWDDPSVVCQRLLHEAQHRLWASPSLQRCKGQLSCYRCTLF